MIIDHYVVALCRPTHYRETPARFVCNNIYILIGMSEGRYCEVVGRSGLGLARILGSI